MSLKGAQGIIEFQWKREVLGFWEMILSGSKSRSYEASCKTHSKNRKLEVVDETQPKDKEIGLWW